jgi:hypothetical protein
MLFLSEARVSAGKCPFGYESKTDLKDLLTHPRELQTVAKSNYPGDLFKCSGKEALTTVKFTEKTYDDIVKAVDKEYEKLADTAADNLNPRASFAGCLVRTAGHDFMDFRIKEDGTV